MRLPASWLSESQLFYSGLVFAVLGKAFEAGEREMLLKLNKFFHRLMPLSKDSAFLGSLFSLAPRGADLQRRFL